MASKFTGSDFDEYLLENLRESDEFVFLHIKDALENPGMSEPDDFKYLIKAISDVANARGKSDFIEKSGITRQGLYKILNGKSVPSIQNVMSLLSVLGLRFSIDKIKKSLDNGSPANVLDVAQYASCLIPRNSTYMKLEKIVYYAQVESLVNFKRPLFKEKIEAWAAGPVVLELYEKHRGRRCLNEIVLGNADNLSLEQKTCIDWAVEKFGIMDGDTLSRLTHMETPWINARKGVKEGDRSQNEISLHSMEEFYSNLPNYLELDDSES